MRRLADIRVLQRDLHIVAQIGAALPSGAAAATATHAEEVVEDVREGGGKVSAETVRARTHAVAVFEGSMAETIIGRAFVRVLENLVGLVDLLETMLGFIVTGIAIRMALHRLLAKGSLDVRLTRGAFYRQCFVIAALGHHSPPDDVQSFQA